MTNQQEYFPVLRLHRHDLLNYFSQEQVDAIPDDEMEELADKLANALLDDTFWVSLRVLAKETDILASIHTEK